MKISNANLEWREDGMPYAVDYSDIYFSRDDAESESEHVFIAANSLRDRWQALPAGSRFTIAELGFGSGLNFMQSLRLWQEMPTAHSRLHYIALELHPFSLADMRRLHAFWPACAKPSSMLLPQYPEHTAGCHRLQLQDNVTLDLYYGDAAVQLASHTTFAHCTIDCWYLDGFSPSHNPDLWHPDLLARVAALSAAGTTLSTYSVAGAVRQQLSAVGFAVKKLPGFGRKREMLLATKQDSPDISAQGLAASNKRLDAPWMHVPVAQPVKGHAVVIGAGIAGSSTARSLAERGWQVTVLDQGTGLAGDTSAIPQMALRCRLFKQSDFASAFFTQAFLFANRQFHCMQARHDMQWHATGVVQLHGALNRNMPFTDTELTSVYSPQIVTPLSQAEANTLAGIELAAEGWWLPLGGWLQPAALCAAYLDHPSITLHSRCKASAIELQQDQTWQIRTGNPGLPVVDSDIVVIANGAAAAEFTQCSYLPLHSVRGQTTTIAGSNLSRGLGIVVNGVRTIFPTNAAGSHTVAASYATESKSLLAQQQDDSSNLAGAAANFVDSGVIVPEVLASSVAMRCNSSDRLPVVGRLANQSATRATLAPLGRNARHEFADADIESSTLYYPGLYINIAHGSNGLATCPLSAELLASLISNENLPCAGASAEALNPIRFLVRELKQQRFRSKV